MTVSSERRAEDCGHEEDLWLDRSDEGRWQAYCMRCEARGPEREEARQAVQAFREARRRDA